IQVAMSTPRRRGFSKPMMTLNQGPSVSSLTALIICYKPDNMHPTIVRFSWKYRNKTKRGNGYP
ncbi:MAG: hypothetical protein ACFFCW_48095, partial [Candidatus Hodarchaeota archaeon]